MKLSFKLLKCYWYHKDKNMWEMRFKQTDGVVFAQLLCIRCGQVLQDWQPAGMPTGPTTDSFIQKRHQEIELRCDRLGLPAPARP